MTAQARPSGGLHQHELGLPLGRGVPLTRNAACQLGVAGRTCAERLLQTATTLSQAAWAILERWNHGRGSSGLPARVEFRDLRGLPSLEDTVLLEGEHPGWSLLALAAPPHFQPGEALIILEHLNTPEDLLPLHERVGTVRAVIANTDDAAQKRLVGRLGVQSPDEADLAAVLALMVVDRLTVRDTRWRSAQQVTPLRSRSAQELWSRAAHLPFNRAEGRGQITALRLDLLHLPEGLWPLAAAWRALGPLTASLPTPAAAAADWTAAHLLDWRRGGLRISPPTPEELRAQLQRLAPDLETGELEKAVKLMGNPPGTSGARTSHIESNWRTQTMQPGAGQAVLCRAGHHHRELTALHVPTGARGHPDWPVHLWPRQSSPPPGAAVAACWQWSAHPMHPVLTPVFPKSCARSESPWRLEGGA
ncbi:hypothetical protein [Deinococcus hopiensis]|uniref:Uncharacterized protein n=1 Tax=Deinococcus hopiensis KR-140 TaxID=695939 RepID=A0A1W1UKH4_9DEIO|nr:hypothetical protein [Deinococcus hopiensis]SMB81539.1 hypothetical protein SAMN00790413_04612 [Deinococcus hopiensis KR-140]